MARYTGPVCRLCRRQGEKLMLKGERCVTPKCAVERRQNPPGHRRRTRPRKMSEYGIRLVEKQKVRNIYGVMERQMRRHFAEAETAPGRTGLRMLQILELRLDNAVFRLGFAESRRQARQLVTHGHFTLNGRKTDIASCQVKPGDVIAWNTGRDKLVPYQAALQNITSKTIPGWLSVDNKTLVAKVLSEPSREDIGVTINERLIVEYYSR
ncbi:MAG: 30S ribosomal protein S4 [Dehalococcoidia bacterium]|nr:30S ribosomal protein S4 [Dehalococcoidia bacterium]